jgi:hypothetical protein
MIDGAVKQRAVRNIPIPVAVLSKGKNTHTAERPAAYDLIRGNKSTAFFSTN